MGVTNRLVFDPAEAASSHNVGAFVRAGSDGELIDSTSNALHVLFTNTSLAVTATNLDIRDLVFATDKVDVSGSTVDQGTSPWVVGDGGGSLTVDAVNLDIRDLVAATDSVSSWTKDGAGNSINSTSNALHVHLASGFVDADDSLANTAIFVEARAVSTTLINLTAAAGIAGRKWLYMANMGNKGVFIGPTGTTATDGYPVFPGQQSEFRIGAAVTPMVIGEAGASAEDIRVMQLS